MLFNRILVHTLDILVTFTYLNITLVNLFLIHVVTIEPFHFIKIHQKRKFFITWPKLRTESTRHDDKNMLYFTDRNEYQI